MRLRGAVSHVAAFVAGAIIATAVGAQAIPKKRNAARDRYRTLDTFAQSLSYILHNYVDPIKERELIYGAIGGMMAKLDPHSAFLPPRRYERLRQDTEGEFAGVGITLREPPHDDGAPVVDSVIGGSPAARAGVKAKDRVLSIDGKATTKGGGAKVKARVWHSRLRGHAGTRVTIEVSRGKSKHTYTLVREQVKVPTVEWFVLGPGVGYIGVSKFQEATLADVRLALKKLRNRAPDRKIRALILDLRGNPGGLLDQAIRVADLFLSKGVIVTVGGRSGTPVEREVAHAAGTWSGFKMIVLVDQGSASAAEIVAGALQDHKRATIMGLQSYGKASVQTFLDLPDGSGMKLTTARYYTPSGRSLEGSGITPDIQVEAFEPEDIVAGSDTPDEPDDDGQEDSENPDRSNSGADLTLDAKLMKRVEEDYQLSKAYQTVSRWVGSKK